MFKEILQIVPKLSAGDLATMERTLSTRFGNVAKKFGKGLIGALSVGGIAGLATGFIDKLLNPLKETQDAIDRILEKGDNLATYAKQFGTTSGELARLVALGQAKGITDPNQMFTLIEKFQGAVAEAIADPNKQTSVRRFTGFKDVAEGFFQFIQSVQKLDPNKRVSVQQEVFGEKQILKMSEFLNEDLSALNKRLGGPSAAQLTPRIERIDRVEDLKSELGARRGLIDIWEKGGLVTQNMARLQDERAAIEMRHENEQIKNYEKLAEMSNNMAELLNLGKEALNAVNRGIQELINLKDVVKFWGDKMKNVMKVWPFGGK